MAIDKVPELDDFCCIKPRYPIKWPEGFSQQQWNVAILQQLANHEHRIEVLEDAEMG